MNSLTTWFDFRVGPHNALVVELPYRFQNGGTCWVYALGRHANGLCRLAGLFGHETLCFASLFHGVQSTVTLLEGGGLPDLELVKDYMMNHGIPLETPIPGGQVGPLYAVKKMKVHHLVQYPTVQDFEQHLFSVLCHSPVAAAVLSFPSLFGPPHQNGLHYATPFERTLDWGTFVSHLMLATGKGNIGELGFLEFQDSMAGSGGIIRLALGQRTILRFVEMLRPYIVGEADEGDEDDEDSGYSSSDYMSDD